MSADMHCHVVRSEKCFHSLNSAKGNSVSLTAIVGIMNRRIFLLTDCVEFKLCTTFRVGWRHMYMKQNVSDSIKDDADFLFD